jgi:membrane-associated phospholipid phosphatase
MHQLWKQGLPRWLCVFYAALVCLSTLTTKQHFLADIAGGIAVYLLALLVCQQKAVVVQ